MAIAATAMAARPKPVIALRICTSPRVGTPRHPDWRQADGAVTTF
jgi:hypothetical protein